MGMDVIGNAPTSEVGAYFRNNVWWWRPLWTYACEVAPEIINEDVASGGCYNEGHGLDADGAVLLAAKLRQEISSGRTDAYAKAYAVELSELPDEECSTCKGSGVRNDEHVQGKCNGCDGKGKRQNWSKSYPFDVENVQEFAAFLQDSGGFAIC